LVRILEERLGDRGDVGTLLEVEEDHHAPLPLIGADVSGGFLETAEGRISFEEFATRHLEIVDGAAHAGAFLTLMGAVMTNRG
jgi:hypothetical protein